MQDSLLHNCGNLFRLSQRHLQNPTAAMSASSLKENFGGGRVLQRYLMPISATLAAASVVSSLLWSDHFDLAAMVYGMLTTAIAPFLIYFLVKVVSCQVFLLFGIKEDTEEKAQTVTLQLMLLYFAVTFLSTILPGARLLACLYVYAFFMLWHMAGEYLGISDDRRITFMLSEMAVCALSLVLISTVINFITPKHPRI